VGPTIGGPHRGVDRPTPNKVLDPGEAFADGQVRSQGLATRRSSRPEKWLLDWCFEKVRCCVHPRRQRPGCRPPADAVKAPICVVTDTWVSMGDRTAIAATNHAQAYQVNNATDWPRPIPKRSYAVPCRTPRRRGLRTMVRRWAAVGVVFDEAGEEPICTPRGPYSLVACTLRRGKGGCSGAGRLLS